MRTWGIATGSDRSLRLSEADCEAQLELCELGLCNPTAPEQKWLVGWVIAKHVRDAERWADLAAAIRDRDELQAKLAAAVRERDEARAKLDRLHERVKIAELQARDLKGGGG